MCSFVLLMPTGKRLAPSTVASMLVASTNNTVVANKLSSAVGEAAISFCTHPLQVGEFFALQYACAMEYLIYIFTN
jgi:hypothetical protein